MAYGFNDDKSKAEVYSKDDFVIVEVESLVDRRQDAENTVNITEYIDDANNCALISSQFFIDSSPSGGSMVYVGKWISLHGVFTSDANGYLRDAKVFPEIYVYNDDSDGRKVYAKYTVRNESDRPRTVKMRLVFLRIDES